jgi:hypothetical protein
MADFVNGYKNPRFVIRNQDNSFVENIDLMECGKEGLLETHDPEYIRQKLWRGRLTQEFQGWRLIFTLNYNEFINSPNMMKVVKIIDYVNIGDKRIYIVPRVDNVGRFYEVFHDGPIDLGIMRGGKFAKGNKHVKLKFLSVDLYLPMQISELIENPSTTLIVN